MKLPAQLPPIIRTATPVQAGTQPRLSFSLRQLLQGVGRRSCLIRIRHA